VSDSLEIIYYGKGFSKGKNGGQKMLSGITIGRGPPAKAMFSAWDALKAMGSVDMDEAHLKWLFRKEWEKIKRNL